jgi:ABC-type polar amino acid transport system ATPase subunit
MDSSFRNIDTRNAASASGGWYVVELLTRCRHTLFVAVIRKLTEEGMTMIVVTHEMEFAREVATDVTFMDAGVVVEQGPTERMLSHVTSPRLEQFLRRYRR